MLVCCTNVLWGLGLYKYHILINWSLDTGAQPLVNEDETLALAVNGEIYNHRILRKNLKTKYNFKTHSDCEVIIPLVCRLCIRLYGQVRLTSISVHGTRPRRTQTP